MGAYVSKAEHSALQKRMWKAQDEVTRLKEELGIVQGELKAERARRTLSAVPGAQVASSEATAIVEQVKEMLPALNEGRNTKSIARKLRSILGVQEPAAKADVPVSLPPGIQKLSYCRSCWAPVLWCKTLSGKRMPVDAKPVADGDLGISNTGVTGRNVHNGPNRYTSHFSTCPNASSHRKRA